MSKTIHRPKIIQIFFIIGATALLGKAMHLQIFDKSIQDKARSVTIDKTNLYPSRGLIYDRNNKILTINNPIYDLMVTYNQLNWGMDTTFLCDILDIDTFTFKRNINKNFKSVRYSKAIPFTFLKKISTEKHAKLQEVLFDYPGFSFERRNIRGYRDTIGAHVLGYISEVDKGDIKRDKYYKSGDYIGSSGLEATYEKELRGKKGKKFMLKDNMGRTVEPYKDGNHDTLAISGNDIQISIDLELQRYAELLMQNKTGAIVILNPKNGEVLSFVSAPTYDPNLLTIQKNRGKDFASLSTDPLKPFFNRAIGAQYPPGSLFKPIVALIALQEGVITPNKYYACNGGYWNYKLFMGCHNHVPATSVSKAIQFSCNSYFFQTFRELIDKFGYYNADKGLENFNSYLKKFGLGQRLGLDYIGEKKGNIPSVATYDKMYPKKNGGWKSPTIISLGIGQGEIELTTLQMANLAAILANRGYYYKPHLIKTFLNTDKKIDKKYKKKNFVGIDEVHFNPVIQGMENVLRYGTARNAQIQGIKVCGKTGTAQNTNRNGKDHSIFFAFAPKDDPKIAMAVYVENAGYGTTYAAPIVSLLIEKYLKDSIPPNRKYLENFIINANLIEE